MSQRTYYIDRLRVVLTALVILHHTAITYGAPGGWFYNELHPSAAPSSQLLTVFVAVNQAFFMGFFFLLSGYYTPGSYERKGWRRFLIDRFIRLGIPLVVFIVVLAPLTIGIARGTPIRELPALWLRLMKNGVIVNGPLWFAQALLLFSLAYCLWKAFRRPETKSPEAPLPSGGAWLYSALGVGLAAFLIRLWVPVGLNVFGLQLGYFASYIFLFALGCVAWRGDWLNRLPPSRARTSRIVALSVIPLLPLVVLFTLRFATNKNGYSGGFNPQAAFYALWEPFVAWGVIASLIVWFRDRWNNPSRMWEMLGKQAYAVYIIHPPILVGMALLLHPWAAPALVKFAVTGTLTCIACVVCASLILLIPGTRRVL